MIRWNGLRIASLTLVVLAAGCSTGEGASGVACKGPRTRCRVPAGEPLTLSPEPSELWLLGLPSLEPSSVTTLPTAPQAIQRPVIADGSLWIVPRFSEAPYVIRQLDMDGTPLSEYSLAAPDAVGTRSGQDSFQEFGVAVGSRGPVLSAAWDRACKGEQSPPCQLLETLAFAELAERGPARRVIGSPIAWDAELAAQQLPGSSDLLVLHSGSDLALQRFDARGKLLWQQGALNEVLADPLLSAPSSFVRAGELVLAGLSAMEPGELRRVALVQLDQHGNVATHNLVGPFPDDLVGPLAAVESADGTVVLGAGDIDINVRLQRFSATGQALDGLVLRGGASVTLAADELGNVFVRTVAVGLLGSHAVLCKLPVEGATACFSAPALDSSIAVSGDGQLFGLDRNQQLLRYDLP